MVLEVMFGASSILVSVTVAHSKLWYVSALCLEVINVRSTCGAVLY
jgi:hypothetical protein